MKGVKLGKSQMIGKDDSKKMAQNNHKNKKNKENETRNATPSSSGIKKYLVRKEENIENDISISPGTENKNNSNKKISPLRKTNKTIIKEDKLVRGLVNKFELEESTRGMKKTFTTSRNNNNSKSVSKKIENFNNISKNSDNCLIGSGRCASHNSRLVRVVQQKKTSVILKDGTIGWRMCEAVTLACPAVNRDGGPSDVSGQTLSDVCDVTANKKARVTRNFEWNQSDLSTEKDLKK